MNPSARISQMRLAMMMLTRLPVGYLNDPVPTLAQARWAFPLIGLPVGLICWAVFSGAIALGLPPLTLGVIAVAAMAFITGGLHFDGLSDFADGLGGRDTEQRLEIMRDSRIGSYGALVMILVSLAMASAIGTMVSGIQALLAFLLMAVASRMLMLAVLDLLPPARTDGLGKSASGTARLWIPGLALLVGLTLIWGFAALGVLAAMAFVAVMIAQLARKRLGGQTGDVLGAIQLSTETTGWVLISALL